MAQILSYMLSSPVPGKPCFGLITNGGSYVFLKLIPGDTPRYALSRVFDLLNPGNDLYYVLDILKGIGKKHLLQQADAVPATNIEEKILTEKG
ncbi:MAG: hypothetical protein D3904_03470 [Candidatus Electrothrix sp. EH2]|nr:hypothetical protein [Candidatus Electrothrix sp. EH2]